MIRVEDMMLGSKVSILAGWGRRSDMNRKVTKRVRTTHWEARRHGYPHRSLERQAILRDGWNAGRGMDTDDP